MKEKSKGLVPYKTLERAIFEAEDLCPGEVVHIYADGSVGSGTDHCTTTPGGPDRVVATYDPERSTDPWDCIEVLRDLHEE